MIDKYGNSIELEIKSGKNDFREDSMNVNKH